MNTGPHWTNSCIDDILFEEEVKRRARAPADVNDNGETLNRLKALRPHLYYTRGKYCAKWFNPVRQFITIL